MSVQINSVKYTNLKDLLKILMDYNKDIDLDYKYDESYDISAIIDNENMNILKQLDEITKKIFPDMIDYVAEFDRDFKEGHRITNTNSVIDLIKLYSCNKINFKDYYESSHKPFIVLLKISVAYREIYENIRFHKTKSARFI